MRADALGRSAGVSRKRILLILLALVLVAIATLAIAGYCVVTREVERVSVDEALRDAEAAVRVGAARDEVYRYLDDRGYEHWFETTSGGSSFFDDNDVPLRTPYVGAVIRDTYKSFLVKGDIYLYFLLDRDLTIRRILVEGFYTGP